MLKHIKDIFSRVATAGVWALAALVGFALGAMLAGLLSIFIDYGAWFWWAVAGSTAAAVAWHWWETER